MALVPLNELLAKHGISRGTYHNLLRKGLLPTYSKRFGEPGKRGARYLYDSEVFDAAYLKYKGRRKFGLGIDANKADERRDRMLAMSKHEQVSFILENIPPGEGESLSEYDARIQRERDALMATADETILLRVNDLFEAGFKPRSTR
jgi:hypothetical protein